MMPPFPIEPPPTLITCASAGEAIETLRLARVHRLRATYLPTGGTGCATYTPITHRVFVMGDKGEIEKLIEELKVNHEEEHPIFQT